jgi:hypothetical protein
VTSRTSWQSMHTVPDRGSTNRATRNETMIANTGGTSIGSGEDGLINALRRERTRYHERESALLARVLGGSGSSRSGPVVDRAGPDIRWAGRRSGSPSGPSCPQDEASGSNQRQGLRGLSVVTATVCSTRFPPSSRKT